MLNHRLIHRQINEILGRAGHHAKILIADGNYPTSTRKGPNAELVCLNLAPGIVTVAQVLRAVLSAMPVDAIHTMGIPGRRSVCAERRAARVGGVPAGAHGGAAQVEVGANLEVGFLQGRGIT